MPSKFSMVVESGDSPGVARVYVDADVCGGDKVTQIARWIQSRLVSDDGAILVKGQKLYHHPPEPPKQPEPEPKAEPKPEPKPEPPKAKAVRKGPETLDDEPTPVASTPKKTRKLPIRAKLRK